MEENGNKNTEVREERRIGDEFEVNGVRLRVEKATSACAGCFLQHDHDCDAVMGKCCDSDREDGNDVVAVPVEGLKEECRMKFTGKNLNDVGALRCVKRFDAADEYGTREWVLRYAGKDCHVEIAYEGMTLIQMNDGTGRAVREDEGLAEDQELIDLLFGK